MLMSLVMRPLLHPLMNQLCLFRALVTGGRIPGTNLILLPAATVAATRTRFGRIEQLLMALAGGWLLCRVVCCKLADKDNSKDAVNKNKSSSRNTSELDVKLEEQRRSRSGEEEDEQIFWQGHRRYGGLQPTLRFTRQQLDAMLRLDEQQETELESETESDSEYVDISDDGGEGEEQQPGEG